MTKEKVSKIVTAIIMYNLKKINKTRHTLSSPKIAANTLNSSIKYNMTNQKSLIKLKKSLINLKIK